jgi:hypothetical protein
MFMAGPLHGEWWGSSSFFLKPLPHLLDDPCLRDMSRYTIFLPAPSYSDLKRDVRRTWVVKEHHLNIPDPQPAADVSDNGMEVDEESLKDTRKQERDERRPSAPSKSLEAPRMPKEESMGDASALLFSQRLSKLYDGAVLRDDDLDEEYAFSQADEISEDSGKLFSIFNRNLSHVLSQNLRCI